MLRDGRFVRSLVDSVSGGIHHGHGIAEGVKCFRHFHPPHSRGVHPRPVGKRRKVHRIAARDARQEAVQLGRIDVFQRISLDDISGLAGRDKPCVGRRIFRQEPAARRVHTRARLVGHQKFMFLLDGIFHILRTCGSGLPFLLKQRLAVRRISIEKRCRAILLAGLIPREREWFAGHRGVGRRRYAAAYRHQRVCTIPYQEQAGHPEGKVEAA